MLQLRIVTGAGAGRVLPLEEGVTVRIGRTAAAGDGDPAVSVALDDPRLSRQHCEVFQREGGWHVRDLDSSNGTLVNAERVTERALKEGDLLQLGGTVIEVCQQAQAASGTRARQRRAAPAQRGLSMRVWLGIAAGLGAAGFAIWMVSPGGGAPTTTLAGSGKTAPAPPAPRPAPVPTAAPGETAPAPAADVVPALRDQLAEDYWREVEAAMASGDWKGAARRLEAPPVAGVELARLPTLREQVRAGSERALNDARERTAELARRGQLAAACEELELLALRLPEAMLEAVFAELGKLREREAESLAAQADAADASVGAPEGVRFRRQLGVLFERATMLRQGKARPEEWQALLKDVSALVAANFKLPDYAAVRRRVRALHRLSYLESHRSGPPEERFGAAAVEWSEGRIRVRYDFTTEAQLAAFKPARPGTRLRRQAGLVLAGEVRLLDGDPFEGELRVKVKVPAGGYRPGRPNINIALFTGAGECLRDPDRNLVSLLNANVQGPGTQLDDFVVFGFGYHLPHVEYNGKPWENLVVPGRVDPVPMPVLALIAGRRRVPLLADSRDCLFAEPLGETSGAVQLTVALERGVVVWQIGTRRRVDLGDASKARLAARQDWRGSVTLLTGNDEVRFASLEIEGRLRPGWVEQLLEETAGRALEELER